MNLVFLGPPGAGKGTHAKILCENFGMVQLATGDILRQHIRNESELGKQAKDTIENGGLVSDELINNMMFGEIKKVVGGSKGVLLDGYPRTIGQAEGLDRFLKSENLNLDAVINFNTSEKVVIDRLSGRRICPNCNGNFHIRNIPPAKEGVCDNCGKDLIQRKDDQPETIKNRLATYHKETAPLIGYYEKAGLLNTVPGDYEVPELQAEFKTLFEKLQLSV